MIKYSIKKYVSFVTTLIAFGEILFGIAPKSIQKNLEKSVDAGFF